MTLPSDAFWLAVVRAKAGEAGASWVDQAARAVVAGGADALCAAYTSAPKHVGRSPLALTAAEQQALAAVAPGLSADRWTIEDATRCAILLGLAGRIEPHAFADAAVECFERGDSREQQSWLRSVGLLPAPERFLSLVVDACRTNILPVFEAVACENPYPARHFPDRNFNQLVLKALFNAVALARIVGLPARLNAELARMAADYAAERRAAGRSVPADIGLAMLNAAPEELRR